MLNISQVILIRTDSNLCRKELTVHWIAPNSLIRSYLQPCTNSMWGDESEAVAPIIWLYQIVDAQKEEVFFPELLITLRSYAPKRQQSLINTTSFAMITSSNTVDINPPTTPHPPDQNVHHARTHFREKGVFSQLEVRISLNQEKGVIVQAWVRKILKKKGGGDTRTHSHVYLIYASVLWEHHLWLIITTIGIQHNLDMKKITKCGF